jgi:hypothetical protein
MRPAFPITEEDAMARYLKGDLTLSDAVRQALRQTAPSRLATGEAAAVAMPAPRLVPVKAAAKGFPDLVAERLAAIGLLLRAR